jgi:hypothetical protein
LKLTFVALFALDALVALDAFITLIALDAFDTYTFQTLSNC